MSRRLSSVFKICLSGPVRNTVLQLPVLKERVLQAAELTAGIHLQAHTTLQLTIYKFSSYLGGRSIDWTEDFHGSPLVHSKNACGKSKRGLLRSDATWSHQAFVGSYCFHLHSED